MYAISSATVITAVKALKRVRKASIGIMAVELAGKKGWKAGVRLSTRPVMRLQPFLSLQSRRRRPGLGARNFCTLAPIALGSALLVLTLPLRSGLGSLDTSPHNKAREEEVQAILQSILQSMPLRGRYQGSRGLRLAAGDL